MAGREEHERTWVRAGSSHEAHIASPTSTGHTAEERGDGAPAEWGRRMGADPGSGRGRRWGRARRRRRASQRRTSHRLTATAVERAGRGRRREPTRVILH